MAKYGIPYMGSKSGIADKIISFLPKGERFCDLFGGGFAMTECAMKSGRFDSFLYNELNPLLPPLIKDAIAGKLGINCYKGAVIMDTKTIGNKLKYFRKQHGLTQQALADEFNIKQDDISRYENDKQDLNLSILRLYCKRFGVSADYLLGLTDTPTNDKDVRAICDYTGLSESAVKTLHTLNENRDNIFSGVLSEFTPIIDYLINDIGLKFNKDAKCIYTNQAR